MQAKRRLGSAGIRLAGVALIVLLLGGCGDLLAFRRWMYDQAKEEPFEFSEVFEDGRSMRPRVPGTVASGEVRTDDFLYSGLIDGEEVDMLPFPITEQMLNRGEELYNINCSPCHGLSGYGNGMIARRGGTPPLSYHSAYGLGETQTLGHYYNVITNGYRNMYPYAQKVAPEDRWAIASYIRALQLSQNATLDDVPEEMRGELEQQGFVELEQGAGQ